ncbi:MAG: F0F1 ATP synthase subunit A [Chloroflexi bacterium]|nr:F0F1 ATP synthase subunit A [Chloroflexota bacterium]
MYTDREPESAENRAPSAGEAAVPVSLNTAHIGIILKQDQEGVIDIGAGGEFERSKGVAEIFPLFRAIATDLNLPLAIALWAFIFVQLWGIQSLGLRTNFGKFIGVGGAAVVKGPIGFVVGLLEIISELARIISFTFRLFGNIFAGEVVLFMAAFLVPFLAATVFYGLEVFVGFIQAFVFAMLTLVFAVTAVSHGEHGHDEEETGETAGH